MARTHTGPIVVKPETTQLHLNHQGDSPSRPTRLPYLGALDGLRCIAVLAVLLHHTSFAVVSEPFRIPRGGFLGVDIFFVVSGFLITALLLVENERKGSISVRGFYWRRIVRLLPALLPVLLAHGIYTFATGRGGATEVGTIFAALGFVTNWWWYILGGEEPGLGHLWSLAVEEQFYLIWPAVVIAFIRHRKFSTSVAIIGTAIVASMLWRIVLWSRTDDWLLVYIRTEARTDQLLIGALLALLWFHGKLPKRMSALAWLSSGFLLVTLAVASPDSSILYNGGYTVIAIATAIVVAACINGDWAGTKVLNLRPMRVVGRVSYGLYLWHLPVIWVVGIELADQSFALRMFVGLVSIAILTTASWHLLEAPAMRHKHRFS